MLSVVNVASQLNIDVGYCSLLFGLSGLICGTFTSYVFFINSVK